LSGTFPVSAKWVKTLETAYLDEYKDILSDTVLAPSHATPNVK
jgi:hypothetical protein